LLPLKLAPPLLQPAPLSPARLVAASGALDLFLEAGQLAASPLVAAFEVRVLLLERLVLVEQALPVHGPLQLRLLQLVQLLALGLQLGPQPGKLVLPSRQLLLLLGQLSAHLVLERLQVADELLMLLEDVLEGPGPGLGRVMLLALAHQAAFSC